MPVLIVTITAVLQAKAPLGDPGTAGPAASDLSTTDPTANPTTSPTTADSATTALATRSDGGKGKSHTLLPVVLACIGLIMALAAALPLTLVLSSWGAPQSTATAARTVQAGELRAVVGRLQKSQQGYQFRGQNLPVGVAAIPLPRSNAVQPRYVVSQSWMKAPQTLSFYWINNDEPGVHSTPLPVSGRSVLDMSEYQDFWQRPIAEMGFLAKPEHFDQAAIGSVTLTDSLLDAIPALVHHWMAPAPLSHRIINTTTGHLAAPVALQRVLVAALLLIVVVGLAWWWLAPASRTVVVRGTLLAVSGLWLLGSSAHLNQASSLLRDHPADADIPVNTVQLDGAHLLPLVASVKENPTRKAAPLLIANLERLSQFEAQRLPFMVLPTSAAAIDASTLTQVAPDFLGTVVMFGKDAAQLQAKTAELARISTLRPRQSGEGYVVLSPDVE